MLLTTYKYHVVPLDISTNEGSSSKLVAEKVEKILNEYSGQGWEYVRLESVPVTVQTGCLSLLSSGKPQLTYLPQLIFRSRN